MNNKITYRREGDYLIPNLYIKDYKKCDYNIGKYGRLRLNYLKEHKRVLYTELMLNGTLPDHILDVDKEATKQVSHIIKQLAEVENVNENLKQTNQMEWVHAMNNIKDRVEEIVLNEIIYV